MPKKLWLKFPTKEAFLEKEKRMYQLLADSEGKDQVVIYIENPKAMKNLPPNKWVAADKVLVEALSKEFGAENVRVVV